MATSDTERTIVAWICPFCHDVITAGIEGDPIGDYRFIVETGHWHEGANHPAVATPLVPASTLEKEKAEREAAEPDYVRQGSTEQQDTTYLSEVVEAFRKEFFDVTGDRLNGSVVLRGLRAAEPFFANHYEQKGAEGERERIAGEVQEVAAKARSAGYSRTACEIEALGRGTGTDERQKLLSVFRAAVATVFHASDPERLREKLNAQREAIIAFNQPTRYRRRDLPDGGFEEVPVDQPGKES